MYAYSRFSRFEVQCRFWASLIQWGALRLCVSRQEALANSFTGPVLVQPCASKSASPQLRFVGWAFLEF